MLTLFNRQGVQDQPLTCPADEEGLDRDRVNDYGHKLIQERKTDRSVKSLYPSCVGLIRKIIPINGSSSLVFFFNTLGFVYKTFIKRARQQQQQHRGLFEL